MIAFIAMALLLISATAAEPQYLHKCHPSCGPFGTCTPDVEYCDDILECGEFICVCQEGYTGEDCSLRSTAQCNDHQCFNGGTCHGNGCDCSLTYGSSNGTNDPYCRFTVTDVCEEGQDHSTYSYCYNQGTCRKHFDARSPQAHPGCHCEGTGFTGSHCQFPVAISAKREEEVTQGKQQDEAKQGLQGGQKALICIIVLTSLVGVGFVTRRRRRRQRKVVEIMEGQFSNSASNIYEDAILANKEITSMDGFNERAEYIDGMGANEETSSANDGLNERAII